MITSKLFKDYFYTFLTFGISFITTIFVYYFISHEYSSEDFEKFNLSRRLMGIVQVFLMMGFAVSLPRSIALLTEGKIKSIFIATNIYVSLLLVILFSLVFALICTLFPEFIGLLFWNSTNYSDLVIIISVCMISMVCYQIVFSVARGVMNIFLANTMTVLSAIIPVTSLIFFNNIEAFYIFTSVSNFSLATIFFLLLVKLNNYRFFFSFKLFKRQAVKLLNFGLPRIPGDFAIEGIMSLPVFVTAHLKGSSEASHLSFAISLLSMLGTLLAPVNLILLPLSANLIASKNMGVLKNHINKLFLLFIPVVIILTIVFNLSTDFILEVYLNSPNDNMEMYLKIVSLSFIPYMIYLLLRSVNDAFYSRPVNSINSIISLTAFLVSLFLFKYFDFFYNPASFSLLIGILSLSFLSYTKYCKIYS